MANVTITNESYREADYLDCSVKFNQLATISGVGLTISGTLRIDDQDSEFEDGDTIYVSSVQGTTELNDRTFEIYGKTNISGSYEEIITVSGVPTATGIVWYPTTLWDYGIISDGYAVDMSAYTTWVSGTGTVERFATTISGLDHLEGLVVKVKADVGVLPDQTVVAGTITVPYPIKYAIIGLGYDAFIQTMPLEAGNEIGTAIGSRKKISNVAVRLYQSAGVRIGPTPEDTKLVNFRKPADDMDTAVPLFTGDKNFTFNKGNAPYQTITIKSEDPLPLTVLAIVPSQVVTQR